MADDNRYRKKIKKKGLNPRATDEDHSPSSEEGASGVTSPSEVAAAGMKQCRRIRLLIEQTGKTDNQFLADVYDKVGDMAQTIERIDTVTERQQSALDNWEGAVRKFLRPDDRRRPQRPRGR